MDASPVEFLFQFVGMAAFGSFGYLLFKQNSSSDEVKKDKAAE